MNFVDPDDVMDGSYKKASNLPNIVSQSPEEIADTGRMEAQYRDENLKRIDKELSRPSLSPVAKKALEEEKGRLSSTQPASFSFIDPDDKLSTSKKSIPGQEDWTGRGTPAVDQTPQRNLIESAVANTMELWKDESLPAHLYNAQQKGVFDKPVGELVHNASDAVKKFSFSELWDAVKNDPAKFGKEFIKGVVADPYLLFAPMGIGGKLTQTLGEMGGRAGKIVGSAAEAGVATAGMEAPISAAKQLDEHGFVDPSALAQDLKVSFITGAALGGVIGMGGAIAKVRPADIATTMQYGMEHGDSLMKALGDSMEVHGVPEAKVGSLIDSLKSAAKESPDLEADFKKMREGLKPLLEEAPPLQKEMTPAQAKKDLGTWAAEMKKERVAGEASDAELQKILDDVKAQEEGRLNPKPEEPDLTTPFRDEPALEAQAAKARIASGEAKAFGEEPSALAAKLDTLKSKRTLTPSEAKEMVDIQAHLDSIYPFKFQRGGVDPEMLKWMGAGVAGAAVGGYLADDKAKGAAIGAALALGGGVALRAGIRLAEDLVNKLKASPTFEKLKASKAFKQKDAELAAQSDTILSKHEAVVGGTALAADRLAYAIKKLVPNEARRGELIHAIQEGRVHELAPNERTAAELFQNEMRSAGEVASKEGIINNLINDGSYVTQLWKDGEKAKSLYASVSPEAKFAKDRLIPSYKEGMARGLVPKTLDLAEIARIYGQSIGKTIANKRLLQDLQDLKINGKDAIISAGEGEPFLKGGKPNPEAAKYADYVPLDHPQMRGKLVNPELAPSLSHVFASNNVPAYLAAMTAVSSAAKRGIFSFSGFHIKSLLDVAAGLAVGLGSPKTLSKIPSMYRMIKEGKGGDFADEMMRAGLKIDPHSGIDMDNDVFRSMMKTSQEWLSKQGLARKTAALPLKAVDRLDKGMQFILWEYLHPAMKLAAASAMFEKRMLQNSKALNANPAAKVPSVAQIQREIADATNDLFGGINWRRVSGEVENQFLHSLTSSITNPQGLRVQRVALLAPDWTVATARSGYKGMKALAKTLIPGQKLSVADQMYRSYFLGSALLYATIGDALNLHFSGHHLWENNDPTYVDLGDGRKLQLSKHFMEPFHWVQHPGQTVINKMGYVPKEILTQSLGVDYIAPYKNQQGQVVAGPEMQGSRVGHALKGLAPITTQQTSQEAAALGFVGLPIYGHTEEEKRLLKRQQEIARRQQRQFKQRNK